MKMVKFDKLTEAVFSKYELNKSISMVASTLELSDELSYFSIGENTKHCKCVRDDYGRRKINYR